jgi:hypothetical protein
MPSDRLTKIPTFRVFPRLELSTSPPEIIKNPEKSVFFPRVRVRVRVREKMRRRTQ